MELIDRADLERAFALYLPIAAVLVLRLVRRLAGRGGPAILLGALWMAPMLIVLQCVNRHAGWWSFPPGAAALRGMPLELWLGWIVLWGILPAWMLPTWGLWRTLALLAGFDLIFMPLCSASIHLGSNWLRGEALALGCVLLPGLCICHWTMRRTHLRLRVAFQLAIAALLFLFLVPEVLFALRPGVGWSPLLARPAWMFGVVFLFALPGISGAFEFAERGGGTPLPYDPPERLVVSGIYRYVANPMQLFCALAMLLWAAMLRSGWMLIPAFISVVYSAGLAEWDERQDLAARFGEPWRAYRSEVRNWLPRLLPYTGGTRSRAYLAASCGPCSQIAAWIARRRPAGLDLCDAENLPAGSICRMRYDPGEGCEPVHGVVAFARVLEHLNAGWALLGMTMRLPGVWRVLQVVLDASGLGPRELVACGVSGDAGARVE